MLSHPRWLYPGTTHFVQILVKIKGNARDIIMGYVKGNTRDIVLVKPKFICIHFNPVRTEKKSETGVTASILKQDLNT